MVFEIFIPFLKFILSIATVIIQRQKSIGCPSKSLFSDSIASIPRKVAVSIPAGDFRFYGVNHWPEHSEEKRKWQLYEVGQSRVC